MEANISEITETASEALVILSLHFVCEFFFAVMQAIVGPVWRGQCNALA